MQRRSHAAARESFDAYRLAASRGELTGEVDPAALPRLADRVTGAGGRVRWSIRGDADAEGRPAIVVAIEGAVPLTCQRCLGVVEQPVAQSTLLLLARDEAELVRLDEASEHEVVPAGSIVMNQSVALEACAVAHGNLTVTIASEPVVVQPAPFASGRTVVTERADVQLKQEGTGLVALPAGARLADVVKALNMLGASPADLLAILQAMKSAGALRAALEII